MKKFISVLLIICVLSGVLSVGFTASAAYDESSYKLTGNQAADIVGIALTQVGYHDGYSNNTKYGSWAGHNYVGWCDIFISWCAAKAGVSTSVVPQKSFGGAESGMSWFINKGQFKYRSSGYTPKPGDIMFLDWNYNNSPDHVGIVVEAYSDGSVRIVDGNYSDKVNDRLIYPGSGMVWNNITSVIGYGTPAYTTGNVSSTPSQDKACDAYYKIATNDTGLILRDAPVSGKYITEMPKGTIVRVTKTTVSGGNTWGYTTYNGKSGWCHMGYTSLIANVKDIKLTATADTTTVKIGESVQLKGTIAPDGLAKLGGKWTSSDPSIVKVDANGKATAVSAGKATLTYASSVSLGTPATIEIVVPEPAKVDGYYFVKAGGDDLVLRAEPSTKAKALDYAPDQTLLHITEAKNGDGRTWGLTTYNGKSGWVAMDFTELVALGDEIAISVVPTMKDMFVGGESDFTGKISPATLAAHGGVWSSSDSSIVEVDQNGHAVAKSAGTAILTYASKLGIGTPATVVVTVRNTTSFPGDVDFDGKLSVADIMKTRLIILLDAVFDANLLNVYDADADGDVTVSDILAIKNQIMKQG